MQSLLTLNMPHKHTTRAKDFRRVAKISFFSRAVILIPFSSFVPTASCFLSDEYGFSYKHITIHLDAIHMPCAELLLPDDKDFGVGDDAADCASALTAQFTPYVFVRFHFFRHGTQTSRLVSAPRLNSSVGRANSGVVQVRGNR